MSGIRHGWPDGALLAASLLLAVPAAARAGSPSSGATHAAASSGRAAHEDGKRSKDARAGKAGATRDGAARDSARTTIDQVVFDFARGIVEAPGAGAADLRAPNAGVARLKAERTARTDAARRLHAALASLPHARLGHGRRPVSAARLEELAASADTEAIDWGSDGSVTLTLRLPLDSVVENASAGEGKPRSAAAAPGKGAR